MQCGGTAKILQPLTLTRQWHKMGMDIPLREVRIRYATP